MKPGHNIAGAPILLHLLKGGSTDDRMSFKVFMVIQEIRVLLKGNPSFRPSDITILFGNSLWVKESDIRQKQQPISDMLKQEFKLDTTTIKDHVINNHKDKVVFGDVGECMSYESPCVIFIDSGRYSSNNLYVLMSRTRARLTIISPFRNSRFRQSEHVSVVTWVPERDGNFVKK